MAYEKFKPARGRLAVLNRLVKGRSRLRDEDNVVTAKKGCVFQFSTGA